MRPWEKYATPWQKYREAATAIHLVRAAPKSQQLGGSNDNEWWTPNKYVVPVRDVLGEIDLDPASSDEAPKIAKVYFTKEQDGLKQKWWGRIFLNPPYNRKLILAFVRKLVEEYRSGRVTEAILLTYNNTSSRWWRAAMSEASGICFTNTNIAFIHKTKGQKGRASIGSAFIYFGKDVEKFFRRFEEFGELAVPRKMKKFRTRPATDTTAQIIVLREHKLLGASVAGSLTCG
jgi:phage N-6-adenine-methyltransferase